MPKSYGSNKKGKKSGGNQEPGSSAGCLSSDKGWSPPDGMPDAPGETGKIPRPD